MVSHPFIHFQVCYYMTQRRLISLHHLAYLREYVYIYIFCILHMLENETDFTLKGLVVPAYGEIQSLLCTLGSNI